MGFPDLPLEIIYLITDFLELDSDISALSQTTRQLHVSLDTCLYKNAISQNYTTIVRFLNERYPETIKYMVTCRQVFNCNLCTVHSSYSGRKKE